MELVFEITDPRSLQRGDARSRVFSETGGVIGRHPDCDWSIEDRQRLVSGRHAQVVWRNGEYFLIDLSRNGIVRADGGRLCKGQEVRIHDGAGFRFGAIELVARLLTPAPAERDWLTFALEPGEGGVTPLAPVLDPLLAMQEQDTPYGALDELAGLLDTVVAPRQPADHTPVDHDHLLVPRLIPEPESAATGEGAAQAAESSVAFWQQLGEALGIDLATMALERREALALDAARLLRQCIGGLQRSLRNRDELHREIFGGTGPMAQEDSPLLDVNAGVAAAIRGLLLPRSSAAQASQAITGAFRHLQSHQVAMWAGSRAMARATLAHFSPQQLNWEFERDSSRPVINTAGSRWRAYLRFHHSLSRTDDWSDELLARHFTQAYRDQIRLLSTLHLDCQG